MTPLARRLRETIERDGPIDVARFMSIALHDPAHGYYSVARPLGRGGDFTTAPEIVQVFGELIGAWAVSAWMQAGSPDPVALVELGPGRGLLMADALRATRRLSFAAAVRLHLVEINQGLRDAQRDRLAGHAPSWHARFDEVPAGPALIIANEFFDALPVRQLVRMGGGWHERLVGLDETGQGLAFTAGPLAPPSDAPIDAPEGAILERSPARAQLMAEIARRVVGHGGAALIIDYGHGAANAVGETLQGVSRHRPADPLSRPGEIDLSAHVDFAALAATARAAGSAVHGPVTQRDFLTRIGVEQRAARLIAAATPDDALLIRSGCRRLIDPAEMGSLFKVLAVTRPDAPVPAGFEEPNKT